MLGHVVLRRPRVATWPALGQSPRLASPRQRRVNKMASPCLRERGKGTEAPKDIASTGAAPIDVELVSSMMQKIALLEQKVKKQAEEIQLKDRKIAELKGKMKTPLQKAEERKKKSSLSDVPDSPGAEDLEMRCLRLQTQVWEMERFLNDYGLIWVGESHEQLEDLEAFKDEDELPAKRLWKPGEAIASKFQIDFDLVLENVKDLNALAGEGLSEIEHMPRGARLRQPESLPLTLYQDGMVMGHGPFRPYEEPSTQQYLQDIMDGYFPSELQSRYPNGISLQVTDKRDVVFRERHLPGSFPGPGQVVGHSKSSELQETTEMPGPKLSLEQFLNKLPKSLIHGGQVLDVRDSVRARLQGSDGAQSGAVIRVETPQLAALQSCRGKAAEEAEPPAPGVCTLRIKSESGEQTYIVKMLFTETIGDLRQHLARARGGDSESYEILSTFPQRVYVDNARSLQDCGLVPNASLLLREKAPSKKGEQGCKQLSSF